MVRDTRRTKAQLIGELQGLRERVAELGASRAENEPAAPNKTRALEDIVNRSPVLVFVWRVTPGEWPVEFASENVKRLLGYTADDFRSGRVSRLSITHPDDAGGFEAEVLQHLEAGTREWSQEYRLTTKSGETRWFQDQNLSLEDPSGNIAYIQSIVLDVTDRKRMEAAAAFERGLMTTLLENVPDYIYFKDKDRRFVRASRSFSSLFKRDLEEVIGKTDEELFPEEIAQETSCDERRIMETGIPLIDKEEGGESIAGEAHWVLTTKLPWRDEKGNTIGIFGISREITRRKEAETTLREKEEKYRAIFESMQDVYAEVALDGTILEVSPSVEPVGGYGREEFLGKSMTDLYVDPEARAGLIEVLRQTGSVTDYEVLLRHKDGRAAPCALSARIIVDDCGTPVKIVGTMRDITERKRGEEALRASEATARALLNAPTETAILVEPDGTIVALNNAAAQRLGKSVEELIGTCAFDLFPPRLARLRKAEGDSVVRSGKPRHFQDERAGRLYDNTLYPVIDEEGNVVRLAVFSEDITERRQAEEALEVSERNYREIFNATSEAIFLHDAVTGEIVDVNQAMLEMFGHSRQDVLGRDLDDFSAGRPPYTQEEGERKLIRAIEDGPQVFEWLAKNSEGEEFWVEVGLNSTKIGGQGRVLAVVRNITERKQAEEALRESEKRLLFVLEGSQLGFWDWDIESGEVQRNERWAEMLGYTLEEIEFTVNQWTDLIHPDDRAVAWKSIQDHLEGRAPKHRIEYRMLTKEGKYKWILDQARIVARDAQGKPLRMSGTHTDITEHKQAEGALIESEERFRSLSESSPMGVFYTDAKGAVLYTNPRWHEIAGLTLEESLGFGWTQALHPDERNRLLDEWAECLREEKGYSGEFRFVGPSGDVRWVYTRTAPIRSKSGEVVGHVGSNEDISERKWAEDQVHILTQQLMQAQESERQRISHALHDQVAQDLSSLKMACAALLDTHPKAPVDIRQALEKLPGMLNQSIRTVRNLGYDLHAPALEQLGLISVVREHCESISERKGIAVDFSTAGMNDLVVDLDVAVNLYRLIQEALNNIVQHAAAKNATIRLVASYPKIILTIEDDGKGFDVEERQCSALKERRLGLRVMEERVHQLQGTMNIRSAPMKGTTIRIEFQHKEARSEKHSRC